MNDPNLLIPAIGAFSLLLIGLLLTVYEFYTKRNIGKNPIDHSVKVVDPGEHRELGSAVTTPGKVPDQ